MRTGMNILKKKAEEDGNRRFLRMGKKSFGLRGRRDRQTVKDRQRINVRGGMNCMYEKSHVV